MKKIVPVFLSLLLFLTLPLSTLANSNLNDIKEIIESEYVGEISGNLEQADTIDEVIEMLDPYSAYFTKEEYEAFLNSVDMTTVGIGVIIEKHEKGILITDVIETGSAYKAGIVAGDIIIAVDGTSIVNKTIEEAQSLILGKENTKVVIKLLKENGSTLEKTLTRKAFSMPNVTSELLYGKVGYIALNSFSHDAVQLVTAAKNNLVKQGATSFIVDLQYNGGGYVSTAEELIGMFPGAWDAYKLKLSTGTSTIHAVNQNVKFPKNTRLLVNRFSASASEMTAAALLDQDAAILYGEQTYGKGTMQGFYELEDGSYLKLTVGEFLGPKGTVIKDVGVTPDIVTTSDPLYQAHLDSVVGNLKNYEPLKSLTNVPTTKTFHLKYNKALSNTVQTSSIELVALGGQKVDVSVTVKNNQITVKPIKPLVAGAQYLLIMHPTIKGKNGNVAKTGKYLPVTVKDEGK